jgi:hypothetical protein
LTRSVARELDVLEHFRIAHQLALGAGAEAEELFGRRERLASRCLDGKRQLSAVARNSSV